MDVGGSKDEVGRRMRTLLLVAALTISPVASTATVPCRSNPWWGGGVAVYANMRISVKGISPALFSTATDVDGWEHQFGTKKLARKN